MKYKSKVSLFYKDGKSINVIQSNYIPHTTIMFDGGEIEVSYSDYEKICELFSMLGCKKTIENLEVEV